MPSGNLTMQQMVARQVDMGTYAGPSLIIGHDKGGLVAIAQIETVGATGALVVRKDLGITKIADLKGKKIANQTGSSIGNIFVDQVCPANGLKKGDFQEVRMDVNNMIAAMAAKTVDAMVNIEPYNAIAEAEGIGTIIMDLSKVRQGAGVHGGDAGLRREAPGRRSSPISRRGSTSQTDFKENPKKVSDVIYSFFTSKGYNMKPETFAKAMGRVDVDPASRRISMPYMTRPRRGAAAGKEDLRDPGLEEGAAHRLHGQGARRRLTAEQAAMQHDRAGATCRPCLRFGASPRLHETR